MQSKRERLRMWKRDEQEEKKSQQLYEIRYSLQKEY